MPDNFNEPEDLLSDESFLAWYFKTGGENDGNWERWMEGSPERTLLVRQAVDLLQVTLRPEQPVPAAQLQRAEDSFLSRLEALSAPETRVLTMYRRKNRMIAAAVFLLLGVGIWIAASHRSSRQEWKMEYGQIGKRQLPDGTVVTLNANSRIRYSDNWKDAADREVWMEGEAFFQVSKTPLKSRFIVHTEHFDVIVTGTRFNVVNRPQAENVLLKEGSVTLRLQSGKELNMHPGDFVAFRDSIFQKKSVQPDSLMAWQEQKLIFDKTPLRDLITILDNQYGVHVRLENPSLGDSTISAILPDNNLDVLLQSLRETSDFDVLREGDRITIKAHAGQN